jgi:phospholipid-binding lipoprotein MlaA
MLIVPLFQASVAIAQPMDGADSLRLALPVTVEDQWAASLAPIPQATPYLVELAVPVAPSGTGDIDETESLYVDPANEATPPAPERAVQVRAVKSRHAPGDPLEGFNRASFAVSMAIDKAVLRPAAMGYRHVLPKPARDGLRNVLSNLGEPLVFLNDLLQLRPGRAIRTFGRFAINSTLGFAGLFDSAKRDPFHLPHHPNSLGDTLGYYGVGPGPYLYLPLLGPATLRDAVAGGAEGAVLPTLVSDPFSRDEYQITTIVISGLDQRAEADADLKAILVDAVDPYATLRSVYLQDRAGQIVALKGRSNADPSGPELDDPLEDPATKAPGAPELHDPLNDPAAAPQPIQPQ